MHRGSAGEGDPDPVALQVEAVFAVLGARERRPRAPAQQLGGQQPPVADQPGRPAEDVASRRPDAVEEEESGFSERG